MKPQNKVLSVVMKTIGITLISTGVAGGVFLSQVETGTPAFPHWLVILVVGIGLVALSAIIELPVNNTDWTKHK